MSSHLMPINQGQKSTFFLLAYLNQLFTLVLMVHIRVLDLNCNAFKIMETHWKMLKCAYIPWHPIAKATKSRRGIWRYFFLLFAWANFLATGVFDGAKFNGDKIGTPHHLIHPQNEEVYHECSQIVSRPRFSGRASNLGLYETNVICGATCSFRLSPGWT